MRLDTEQINNLCTGVVLAVELSSDNPDLRRFLTVSGYRYNKFGKATALDRVLSPSKIDDIYFLIRCYEISDEYIINGWDVTEDELASDIWIDDISGIEPLENELSKYLKDFSCLKPQWYCDNPL